MGRRYIALDADTALNNNLTSPHKKLQRGNKKYNVKVSQAILEESICKLYLQLLVKYLHSIHSREDAGALSREYVLRIPSVS